MLRQTGLKTLVLLAASLFAAPAWAGSPLVVDDTNVHAPEEQEWVPAVDILRSGSVDTRTATLSLAVGVNSWMEGTLRAGYGWLRDRDSAAPRSGEGALDVNLGVKALLWEGETLPLKLAASGAAKLPVATVRSGLGTGYADFAALGIATLALGQASLDLNAGFTWTAIAERARRSGDAWFAGAALRWKPADPLMLFAESFANRPTAPGAGSAVTLRVGGQYELGKGLALNLAVGRGRNQGAVESLGTVSLSITR